MPLELFLEFLLDFKSRLVEMALSRVYTNSKDRMEGFHCKNKK